MEKLSHETLILGLPPQFLRGSKQKFPKPRKFWCSDTSPEHKIAPFGSGDFQLPKSETFIMEPDQLGALSPIYAIFSCSADCFHLVGGAHLR